MWLLGGGLPEMHGYGRAYRPGASALKNPRCTGASLGKGGTRVMKIKQILLRNRMMYAGGRSDVGGRGGALYAGGVLCMMLGGDDETRRGGCNK